MRKQHRSTDATIITIHIQPLASGKYAAWSPGIPGIVSSPSLRDVCELIAASVEAHAPISKLRAWGRKSGAEVLDASR